MRPLISLIVVFVLLLTIGLLPALSRRAACEEPRLKATANGALKESFVADESNIRKLVELVKRRIAEQAKDFSLRFTVTFADNSYYDTSDSDVIYKEENPRTRPIIALAILATARHSAGIAEGQSLDAEATEPEIFVKLGPETLSYSVKGASRDWVFNTQSDIRDRFSNMLVWRIRYLFTVLFFLVGFLGIFVPGAMWWRNRYDEKQVKSNSGHKRTNLLRYIAGRVRDPDFTGFWAPFYIQSCAVSAVALSFAGNSLDHYLYPDSIFALGEQVRVYENLVALRSRVLWGIGITLVVGVVSSVIANAVSARRT